MAFYSDSLLLKNICLALSFTTYNFPSTLAETGYTDAYIEYSLVTATLKNVRYDFGAAAPERNRSLVSEIKSGQYAQSEEQERFARQLTAYSELTSDDLIRSGFRVAASQNPGTHEHEVVIIGIDGEMHHIAHLVMAHTFQPPMIAVFIKRPGQPHEMPTFAGLRMYQGVLRDSILQGHLKIYSDWYQIPLPISFDATSSEADIAATILPAILRRMFSSAEASSMVADDLLQEVLDPWPMLGPEEQTAYRGRVNHIIRHAISGHEFRGLINWDNKKRSWRLEPLPSEGSKRQTRQSQLQRKAEALINRLTGPSQEPLALDESEFNG